MSKNKLIFIFIIFCFLLNAVHAQKKISSSSRNVKYARMHQKESRSTYHVFGKHYEVLHTSKNYREKGIASWYGRAFHRRYTSSGERFNMYKLTAAHKSLPLSTRVQVTNLKNGRRVIVKVNDRGPFISNRIIDLSYGAAKKLGMVNRGLAPVIVKALA